jgi:biotin carboxyl carrier protein
VAEKFLKGEAKEEVLKKALPADLQTGAIGGKPAAFNVEVDGESYLVKVAPAGISIEAVEPKAPKDGVTVPMQGVIIRYLIKKGDKVSKGDAVAVLEAMKMENKVSANKDGVVAEIYAEVGATVAPGDILMSID